MEKIKKYLPYVAVLLGVLAIVFLAFPCYKMEMKYGFEGMSASANGFVLIFGGKAKGGSWSYEEYEPVTEKLFDFSIGNLFALIFIALAIIICIVAVLRGNKILKIASAVVFVVAGILFFCMIENCVFYEAAGMDEIIRDFSKLGVGAIFAGIFSMLSAALVIIDCFADKIFKQTDAEATK